MAGEYATAIPEARTLTIAGAGHVSNMEEPDAFTQALQDFFGSL